MAARRSCPTQATHAMWLHGLSRLTVSPHESPQIAQGLGVSSCWAAARTRVPLGTPSQATVGAASLLVTTVAAAAWRGSGVATEAERPQACARVIRNYQVTPAWLELGEEARPPNATKASD
mmetsp:Transcript_41263/g.101817  ORF Transcript_41263/g.101817 Transcript_41263/m.101817 type:complete len:121 (-) Transcript_41263:15-377(-)|eukprot:CAMPEP_0179837566 /NCGR_PEP_ID=MMETSP0982-20121206/90_1 /TAXON_ID=483367 /ORGANISM="non described non described, Strain CCMP 2436" /LENGTH=120 /DNA_ID=CAMNT_0021720637 /DNA_START=978 /DNA_END=1340 /DNA_ORIENTATION=-